MKTKNALGSSKIYRKEIADMSETKSVTHCSTQRLAKEFLGRAVLSALVLLCVAVLTGCAEMGTAFVEGMNEGARNSQATTLPPPPPGTVTTSDSKRTFENRLD